MILVTTDKSFDKRAKKWAIKKDFIIADATEDYGGILSEYGNRQTCLDYVPTPTLKKVAADPDSKESKIKARALPKHLEIWLNDEAFAMRTYIYVDLMCKNWDVYREDMNIFVCFRKHEFPIVAKPFVDWVNETYGLPIAFLLTSKMNKEMQNNIVGMKVTDDTMDRLIKRKRHIKKSFKDQSRLKEMYANLDEEI